MREWLNGQFSIQKEKKNWFESIMTLNEYEFSFWILLHGGKAYIHRWGHLILYSNSNFWKYIITMFSKIIQWRNNYETSLKWHNLEFGLNAHERKLYLKCWWVGGYESFLQTLKQEILIRVPFFFTIFYWIYSLKQWKKLIFSNDELFYNWLKYWPQDVAKTDEN